MGLTDSYAYFLPIHYLYQIVSINLCHNVGQEPQRVRKHVQKGGVGKGHGRTFRAQL